MAREHVIRMGQRIRERREELALTQRELADAIPGKSDGNQVSKWERGEHRVSDETLPHIARALDVDVSYFHLPAPVEGTGDLMQTLRSSADPSQLDRVETLLGELLVRVQRIEAAIPSGAEALEDELSSGGRPPERHDDDTEEDETEPRAEED